MPQLIVPAGIPGCGKSTLASKLFRRATVVSSDVIRASMGDVHDQTKNDEVFRRFHAQIKNGLINGFDVFADATNLNPYARAKLRNLVIEANMARADLRRPDDIETHLIVFANPDQAIMRNQQRLGRIVPQEAMDLMLDKYERFRLVLVQESVLYDSVTEIRSVR